MVDEGHGQRDGNDCGLGLEEVMWVGYMQSGCADWEEVGVVQPPVGFTIAEKDFCGGGDGLYDVDVEGVLSHIEDLGVYSACIDAVVTPWSEGGRKVRGLESVGLIGM